MRPLKELTLSSIACCMLRGTFSGMQWHSTLPRGRERISRLISPPPRLVAFVSMVTQEIFPGRVNLKLWHALFAFIYCFTESCSFYCSIFLLLFSVVPEVNVYKKKKNRFVCIWNPKKDGKTKGALSKIYLFGYLFQTAVYSGYLIATSTSTTTVHSELHLIKSIISPDVTINLCKSSFRERTFIALLLVQSHFCTIRK